jgi:hypothetical protein
MTSANQSPSPMKLIIKAANQKFDDFIVENFELQWTIKHLKLHLAQNYPKNPVSFFQKNF